MSRLGNVLEVLHDSHRRYRSVLASGVAHGRAWRMWWAGPKQIRTEDDRPEGTFTVVRSGEVWWIKEPDGTVHTNDGDPNYAVGFGRGLELLKSRPLMASASLTVLRDAEIAGRPATVLRAEPRPDHSQWRGSDEPFEVAIDLDRGVALRGPGFEVTDIEFDVPIPEETLSAPAAAPGARTIRTNEGPREVRLEEARAAVPFPIRLPRLLPEGGPAGSLPPLPGRPARVGRPVLDGRPRSPLPAASASGTGPRPRVPRRRGASRRHLLGPASGAGHDPRVGQARRRVGGVRVGPSPLPTGSRGQVLGD